MEINPYEARLRMLQQMDGVQMQREAAPDDETAGCPGCPYFWTCPVPHKGEEVRAPQEIEREDVADQLTSRGEYRPRDESDIGWTDVWIEDDTTPSGADRTSEGNDHADAEDRSEGSVTSEDPADETVLSEDEPHCLASHTSTTGRGRRAGERRSLFRRRKN